MQGAEIEDEGSVLTYMTKSEIEEQRSSLLIMTQRLLSFGSTNRSSIKQMTTHEILSSCGGTTEHIFRKKNP